MLQKPSALIDLLRPKQIYKVSIVWLPGLFHGHGSLLTQWRGLLLASLAWWLASGIVYIMNDLEDAPRDRKRPERALRPIASGVVKPWEALTFAGVLLIALIALLTTLPSRLSTLLAIYAGLNFVYTLGLKEVLGIRQTIIALGFWFRLQSGAVPITTIPLTPWASLFTLGLAYYLNSLKGLTAFTEDHHRGYRFAMGMGAGLAGSLVLASLVAICLKRGVEGTMHWPELPPLFCLVGMHRAAFASFDKGTHKEQSVGFLKDPATILVMLAFLITFLFSQSRT